jgi:hypothetical protein
MHIYSYFGWTAHGHTYVVKSRVSTLTIGPELIVYDTPSKLQPTERPQIWISVVHGYSCANDFTIELKIYARCLLQNDPRATKWSRNLSHFHTIEGWAKLWLVSRHSSLVFHVTELFSTPLRICPAGLRPYSVSRVHFAFITIKYLQ